MGKKEEIVKEELDEEAVRNCEESQANEEKDELEIASRFCEL